jgi:hypothetical protein
MTASGALGDFSYTRLSSSDFALKVKLTTGWSASLQPLLLGQLTTTPGG